MKKFFTTASFCVLAGALVSLNVAAQEAAPALGEIVQANDHSIMEAPDTEAVLASAPQDETAEAPGAEETADAVAAPALDNAAPTLDESPAPIVSEGIVIDNSIEGSPVDETFAMAPTAVQNYDSGIAYGAAPVAQSGCGCGAAAPVANYDSGITYDAAPVMAAPIDAGITYGAAPVVAAPIVSSGCSTCAAAAPATTCCPSARSARTRTQVVSRVRGRLTSVRPVRKIGSRRNRGCCN